MLQIKNLVIEGFRGSPLKADPIEFTSPATLIFGDNHQGKSTILNAVEWCLFGEECYGGKTGIRERVGNWEIVNRKVDEAKVDLEIESNEGVYLISRSEKKGKGKKGRALEVVMPDGTTIDGQEAENTVTSLIRLGFRDFSTTVYQHQETIRNIVTQTPKEQSEAIDRLLGLSSYRDIGSAISKARLSKKQEDLLDKLDAFQKRVGQALSMRQEDLDKKKLEAQELNVQNKYLNQSGIISLAEEAMTAIDKFAEDLGVKSESLGLPNSWMEISDWIEASSTELDRLWSESPDIAEQEKLNNRRSEAIALKSAMESAISEHNIVEGLLQSLEQEHGKEEKLLNECDGLSTKLDEISSEITRISPRAKLVEEGMGLLRDAEVEADKSICPLCGKKVPDLLKHLEAEWKDQIQASIIELKEEEGEIRQKISGKKETLEGFSERKDELDKRKSKVDESRKKCGDFLELELTKEDDPVALISNELDSLSKRLEKIGQTVGLKREKLGDLSKLLEGAKVGNQIISLEENIKEIGEITKSEEFKKLDKFRDEIAGYVEGVNLIGDIVAETMKEEATIRLSEAGKEISDYFCKITENPAIKELQIEIKEGRGGANEYRFCDQEGSELNPILSLGDLNGLALAIFLGLVEAYPHPIGFVMLDDPSQSLGTDQKLRLVEVLDKVSKDGRRIIVGTMDKELRGYLEKNLTRTKSIYQVSNWKPEEGPKVVKVS